jgi:hypothetical protein
VDGPTGTVRGNHLKSNGGALADGADANIGRRSGQRKITTPPGPGGHKRGRAPHPLCDTRRGRLRNDLSWANTPASRARCDLAHMPRGVSRGRIAADERRTGGLGKGNAGQCHRRSPHAASALKPASATSLRCSASRRGENRPRKAAGCVCRRRLRTAGVAAQGVQPHGTAIGCARAPWPVLLWPTTMHCPKHAGGDDEKTLQHRRQSG